MSKLWKRNTVFTDITKLDIGDYVTVTNFVKEWTYYVDISPGPNTPDHNIVKSTLFVADNARLRALIQLMAAKNVQLTEFSSDIFPYQALCTVDLLLTLEHYFPLLTKLNLKHCLICQDSIREIVRFKKLEVLNFGLASFFNNDMSYLLPWPKDCIKAELTVLFQKLSFLKELNLEKYDTELPDISTPTLQKLELSHCPEATREYLEKTVTSCQFLTNLIIWEGPENDQMDLVFRKTPNLKQVALNNISNSELHELCWHCPQLTELKLMSLSKEAPTDLSLITMLKHLRSLTYNASSVDMQNQVLHMISGTKLVELDFSDTQISDENLLVLTKNSVNLEKLTLLRCYKLTTNSLNRLSVLLPKLREIIVCHNEGVTDSFLQSFGEHGNHISMIDVTSCSVSLQGVLDLIDLRIPRTFIRKLPILTVTVGSIDLDDITVGGIGEEKKNSRCETRSSKLPEVSYLPTNTASWERR